VQKKGKKFFVYAGGLNPIAEGTFSEVMEWIDNELWMQSQCELAVDAVSMRRSMNLRELMTYCAVTQSELAARIGITQAPISRWVTGKRNMNYSTAARIAAALDALVAGNEGGEWVFVPKSDSQHSGAESWDGRPEFGDNF